MLSLAAALTGTARAQVIYNDELVDGLPGPEALYDPDRASRSRCCPSRATSFFPAWACRSRRSAWPFVSTFTISTA